MAWSGGTYTKGNNATGGWVGDASLGIGIEAGRHDTQDNDFATGINQCVNKDGSNSFTGNPNLGGYIPTNVGAGTAAAPAFCAGNDSNTGIFSAAADQIGIATNGTERVRIDSSGRLGLNTTTPDSNISIRNTDNNVMTLEKYSADANGGVVYIRKSRGASAGTNTIVQNGDSLGDIYWQGADGSGYSRAAAIAAKVDGTPGATNDMPGRLEFYTSPDGTQTLTERMRIISGGQVCINRTSASDPSEYLTVGDGSARKLIVSDGGTSGTGGGGGFLAKNGGTTVAALGGYSAVYSGGSYDATPLLYFNAAPRIIGLGTGAGTWPMKYNTSTNAWTYDTSKRSSKDNIRDSQYGLASVLQLKPRQFNYLGSEQFREDVGFIADEVYKVVPELAPLDAEGEPAGVSYDRLTSVLCKAIQELNAKVESLQAQVEMLQTQVAIA